MLHTVIFIGRSGCGKGTQAELLRNRVSEHDPDKHPILYVETGEKFRHFVRGNSYSSLLSKKIMEADERQPNFLGAYMWADVLINELGEHMHLILDGVARSRPEAEMITTAFKFYEREKPAVIYINVSREWSEKRLLARGRSDDVNLSRIDKRLDWFDRDVVPALDYFKENASYRFIDVNGEQSIDKVHSDIVAAYEYRA